jgi:hypothetical protein
MPSAYKILGQAAPANTNEAALYTVPSNTQTIVSSIIVTNTTAAIATCRIFVRNNGATAATSNAIVYDAPVPANDFIAVTLGLTIDATDVITVRSGTANSLTFHAFGTELT